MLFYLQDEDNNTTKAKQQATMKQRGVINRESLKPRELYGWLKVMGFSNPPEVGLMFVERHRKLTKKYKGRKIGIAMNTRRIDFVDDETGITIDYIEEVYPVPVPERIILD